eukprot:CAMPEP_0170182024 /NCGR_PEP_ID=MMETSP0040_2-20121228/26713_1 /TAXON_ID=641309 /ORGANISM="Lotharella oceanica, Strain CCMP622" /LENGTH=84 /DNA_ID=CAMNT_0010427289 /DNA_START=1001 /DNA_END=1251 /DNA_ORIENTATION=-
MAGSGFHSLGSQLNLERFGSEDPPPQQNISIQAFFIAIFRDSFVLSSVSFTLFLEDVGFDLDIAAVPGQRSGGDREYGVCASFG